MRLVVIAIGDLLAILALLRLGPIPTTSELPAWLSSAPAAELFTQLLRAIALLLAIWIAFSLGVILLTSLVQGSESGISRRLVVPFLRPLLDRALVLALVATPAASPGLAVAPPSLHDVEILPPYVPVPAGFDEQDDRSLGSVPSHPPLLPALPRESSGDTYTVVKGDNLWRISCRQLREESGEMPTSDEIVPYWLELIELNRDRIRSGDPNLIYPGEELLLP